MTGERENRQYGEMLSAAVARLEGVEPGALARRTGVDYDAAGECWRFTCFGQKCELRRDSFSLEPDLDMWLHLSILQYLGMAQGRLPSSQWIGLSAYPGGARGASFDRETDGLIAQALGKHPPERIQSACIALGGELSDGTADLCVDFAFMPLFPLRLNLWYADDEFPASGKILLDGAAKSALSLEAAGTVATELVRMLCRKCKSEQNNAAH